MGRGTYDFIAESDAPWAYGDQRTIVVTSKPIENPKGPLEIRQDVDALITELRAFDDGDVWMLGGGQLQMAFLERGALDEIEIYLIPELIGSGIPLFPVTGFRASPVLLSAKTLTRLRTPALYISRTMIGMARQNGGNAIKLLGNQNAGNLVRPRQFAQRQNEVGA